MNAVTIEEADQVANEIKEVHTGCWESSESNYCLQMAVRNHVMNGRIHILRHIIGTFGVHIDDYNSDDDAPLLLSIGCGQQEIAFYLMKEAGADINIQEDGLSALHVAAKAGMIDILKYLIIERGCFLPSSSRELCFKNPICHAVYNDEVETINLFVEHFEDEVLGHSC